MHAAKLHIEAFGLSRTEFFHLVRTRAEPFIGGPEWHVRGFMMFLNEITKDISQHNGGVGYVTLIKHDGIIEFEVNNRPNKVFKPIPALPPEPREGLNFNNGLKGGQIQGLANGVNVTYAMSKGFCYRGIYIPEIPEKPST